MQSLRAIVALLACLIWSAGTAPAASLRVAPTSLSLVAPDSATALSLNNDDIAAINVQVRVFRWTQVNGTDQLEQTQDVVASPPAVTLKAKATTVIRIVRVSKSPVLGEESYRLLVDELPNRAKLGSGTVALMLRYSIPVFFSSNEASPTSLTWFYGGRGLISTNSGQQHVRISALRVKDSGGRTATLSEGLAGYILGGSTMSWPLAGRNSLALSGRSLTVSAMTQGGQISALAAPR